jgi:predicted nucleic acid-binding protein
VILTVDTSSLSKAISLDEEQLRKLAKSTNIILPLATDAEIRYGIELGDRRETGYKNYSLFKRRFRLDIHMPTESTSAIYAELAAWAKRHGVALSNNDIWIAATTIEVGGKLLTTDKDFARLPQLRLA